MTKILCQAIILVSLLATGQGRAFAATAEQIGGWMLNCPASGPCQFRSIKRFLDKGGITGDLEIQARGKPLFPSSRCAAFPASC